MTAFLRSIIRFIFIILVEAVTLLITASLMPSIEIAGNNAQMVLTAAVSVAIVFGLLNLLVRPLLVLVTMPINLLTVGLFTLVINAFILWVTSWVSPFLTVSGFWAALGGALLISVVNTILTSLTSIDDDYAFYDGVVQWLTRRRLPRQVSQLGRGIIMLEIDGLSYQRAKRAIESDLMPSAKKLIQQGTHILSRIDCGLPSTTSSCQAGIMYGDNHDIPAFRWYDKDQARLFVSNNFADAYEINQRYARGQGLLRGGTSINNLMAGEANNTLMTMSMMRSVPEGVGAGSSGDLYLVFVNPYFFSRAIVLTAWDLLLELFQAARQRLRDVRPRINRLEQAFPLVRALTNVFLRDVSTYTVILDIMRGSPAIYTTFVGYDEIAHHAGPDTNDAMNSLRGFDRQLNRILDVIQRKAPRPYDIFVLSDHGQSFGATFKQRYGQTLVALVEELVAGRGVVSEINATENARGHTAALLAEVKELQTSGKMGAFGRAALGGAAEAVERRVGEAGPTVPMDTDVLVCAGGNFANIYFPLRTGKLSIPELDLAYPKLLEALIGHPGIGLVIGYEIDGQPWALGKTGGRRLRDSLLTGDDPLAAYGDPDLRAEQLLRVADFPHAGDLIVVSTLYEGGRVAAFEELVGSHGGLGGQQTDAFLLHPADMEIPQTRNSAEVYALLNGRRDLPGLPLEPAPVQPERESWTRENLLAGMREVQSLFSRAARVLRFNRSVFREVAVDPKATGQSLLIILILALGSGLTLALDEGAGEAPLARLATGILARVAAWLAAVLLATLAGRALHGWGSFTRALRALSFAQIPAFIGWLVLLPVVGPYLAVISSIMVILATWMAAQEALHLSRLRALLVPVLAMLILIVSAAAVAAVVGGLELTAGAIWALMGLDN